MANKFVNGDNATTMLTKIKGYIDGQDAVKQDVLSPTQLNAVNSGIDSTKVAQIATNAGDITTINSKIPAQASATNQLADKNFVNSSIATNTANFIGTFETISALESYSGTVTNNDYAFVVNSVVTDNGDDWASFSDLDAYDKTLLTNFDYAWVVNGANFDLYRFDIVEQQWDLRAQNTAKAVITLNTAYNRYKAIVTETPATTTWSFEYTLNNSSFTANQWAAINSGLTSADKTKLEFKHSNSLPLAQLAAFINTNIDNPLIKYLKIKFKNSVEVSIPQYTVSYSTDAITSIASTALVETADGYFSLNEVNRTAEIATFVCQEDICGVVSINYGATPAITYKFYSPTKMSSSAVDSFTQTVSGVATNVSSTDATVFNVSYLNDGSLIDPE